MIPWCSEGTPHWPRRLTILGATGSIGRATLEVVAEDPGRFEIEALTAHRRARELAQLARRFRARLAVVADPAAYRELREALAGSGIEAAAGPAAVVEAAARPSELVMAAIVGAAGLAPTLAAVRRGAMVGLANKECLVSAGELFVREVATHDAVLLPVDSEHNAIFQALAGTPRRHLERIILTASGGPFRTRSRAEMARATPAEALAHPNWRMGAKITVDSATMMNKGLEIIEAHHLFGLPEEAIEVVVHPQSVVHGLTLFTDGSLLAQLGPPDMRIPIAHVLAWPSRLATRLRRLDLVALGRLDFEAPDRDRFPALDLAREALRRGGGAPTVLNAANEVAVEAFLAGRIGFLEIAGTVAAALETPLADRRPARLEEVLALDQEVRAWARRRVGLDQPQGDGRHP